ncbi:MAG: excinuclease ABC subunit UvrC [Deltaproteobacteria bacterium]|nr:excinuclease ABC subunit UvrC [Deltaproteobacteria bacterium]
MAAKEQFIIMSLRIKNLPQSPGVYLMKGIMGDVLYVGKAKNIRNRVSSYFRETSDTRYTVKFLASKVFDIEYIVTTNEKEAIILEDTILKKYKPRYNIRLKDDKTYVSIKLTLEEKFPRIFITRHIKKDSSRYFGPYASAQKARETVRFIRRIFPLCSCSLSEFANRVRSCIDYQLGICSAPCVHLISETAYKELVDKTILFLEGRNKELLSALKTNMLTASDSQEFERAAKLRDQIAAIEATLEEQKVVSPDKIDRDIFAHIMEGDALLIQALFIRDGRLGGARDFFFAGQEFPAKEAISSFLSQYYRGDRFIPDEIILSLGIEDKDAIENWLSEKKGKKVKLLFPAKGNRFKLLNMAEINAREAVKRRTEMGEAKQTLLEELQKRLHLRKIPKIIEAFDISNISGKMAVGAMVVFEDAKPNKNRYRLYKIKTLEEPDDYGMMSEVLSKRYKKPATAGFKQGANEEINLPNLILVDGGKGQLNIAIKVLDELDIQDVDMAAIAKEQIPPFHPPFKKGGMEGGLKTRISGEKIYLPNVKDPIILKQGSQPDLFIRKIRDEVHRFAIGYHKKLRGKIKSLLDEIPGIGKARRNILLKHFGSLENMKQASAQEIAKIPGITIGLAEAIKSVLQENNG